MDILKKALLFVVLSFLLLSCGTTKITYDYDDGVNFNKYKTYKVLVNGSLSLKHNDSTRLLNALSKALKIKNFTPSKTPDLIIVLSRDSHDAKSNARVGLGVGQYSRHLGINVGGSIPIPRNATTQMLNLDFRETGTNKLIWESHFKNTYKNALPPLEKEKMFFDLFNRVLSGYPPDTTK